MSGWSRFLPQCKTHKRVYCRLCLELEEQGHKPGWGEILNPAKNVGGGMARIRIFNRSLNGVGYVAKCLGATASCGADTYEMGKFGLETSEVTLSKGAQALLARGIREERRRVQRSEKWTAEEIAKRDQKGMTTVCVPRTDHLVPRGELSSSGFRVNKANRDLFYDLVEASGKKAELRKNLSVL